MVRLHIVGLNCGTSVDGVDVAHVVIESIPTTPHILIELVSYHEYPIPSPLRKRILSLCRTGATTSLEEVCDLNYELGEVFADALLSDGINLALIDAVACHGQTLWHSPQAFNVGKGFAKGERRMSTLQMAESTILSQRTGLTIVNDFRTAELARGRMGAPLAGFFEAALIRHPHKLRVSQNIGGMGNVTVIPPYKGGIPSYTAFDTGPGNVLIDATVRQLSSGTLHYDKDGLMAKAGELEIDLGYVNDFIESVEYLARRPPKTTGRELFSDDMALGIVRDLRAKGLSTNGIVATVTRITGETIARAYETFVIPQYGNIDEIFVCGGGTENPNLMAFLSSRFPHSVVQKLNDATCPPSGLVKTNDGDAWVKSEKGIPADAKEAVLFAVLGFLCLCGRSVPIASDEPHKDEGVLGKITPGKNFVKVMGRALAADLPRELLGQIFVSNVS